MKTIAAILLFLSSVSVAQDLVSVAPKNAKIEFENARVRVVRLKMAPHESLPMHDRPARVVIALAANDVKITGPDGKPRMLHVPAGNIGWGAPTHGRSVETLDKGFENVIVEMKTAKEPAKALAAPPDPRPPGYLGEPLHHWLFENQYVRVYDVRVPAGATTLYHKHAYDTVFVQITDEFASEQPQSGTWTKPERHTAGEVSFSADSKKVRVHRVRNEANSEFHVIAVQLK